MDDILTLSALELSKQIKEKKLTVADAVNAVCQRIEKREPTLHCYLTLRERADLLAQAEKIQAAIDAGTLTGPLAGVPIAVKDNICTEGLRTSCASRMLEHFIPPYSATIIERIEAAGMLILGKTNMDEFGMGSTTEHSAFGVTRNPHNEAHVPGGSSGGSCAAVAAGEAYLALGSDTGGSIRQPAAHCGVVGMKPSYGAVSRYGLIAYASSFDQIGPIGKTVADCEALLSIIRGQDARDATSISIPPAAALPSKKTSEETRTSLRIGIPSDLLDISSGLSCAVSDAFYDFIGRLTTQGFKTEAFSTGLSSYMLPSYYIIACAEASSNLARYDGVKYGYRSDASDSLHSLYRKSRSEGFGKEVQKRILLGTFVLSSGFYDAYYGKAQRARQKINDFFAKVFTEYDFLLLPVTADTAPRLDTYKENPIAMYQSDCFTVPANLAGLPAISIPVDRDKNGLPIGVQLIGPHGADDRLLRLAASFEYINA